MMASEKQNTDSPGEPSQTLTDVESNTGSLEKHFERTSQIIESWPSWKQGLIIDMSRSFATEKYDNDK